MTWKVAASVASFLTSIDADFGIFGFAPSAVVPVVAVEAAFVIGVFTTVRVWVLFLLSVFNGSVVGVLPCFAVVAAFGVVAGAIEPVTFGTIVGDADFFLSYLFFTNK